MPSGSLTKILPKSNNDILYLVAAFALGMFFHICSYNQNKKLNKCSKCNCDDECNDDCDADCVEGLDNKNKNENENENENMNMNNTINIII